MTLNWYHISVLRNGQFPSINWLLFVVFILSFSACKENFKKGSFGYDVALLKKYKPTIILKDGQSQVAVVGDYQGRVMTSTSEGNEGTSYGWINHKLIQTGKSPHSMNIFGGEDRLWFGPEFGPYSIFFKMNDAMVAENIKIPGPIDDEAFDLIEKSETSATFTKKMQLTNYQGFKFHIDVKRKLSIYNQEEIIKQLNINLPRTISVVGFSSENTIKNVGEINWSDTTGLLSIWIIGAFPPSSSTTVLIPTKNGPSDVTSYWKESDRHRLSVEKDVVYYKADGNFLHKIGIKPKYTRPIFGSFDPVNNVLTVVKFSFSSATMYVNSEWDLGVDPYYGDVINVFNDGPNGTPHQFGPFYELETSSHAKALTVGESLSHTHATFHFEGSIDHLNKIAESLLGVGLHNLKNGMTSLE